MKWRILGLCALLTLTGCATGFDRGAVVEQLDEGKGKVTDADIKKVLEKRAQLDFPVKIAVQLVSETYKIAAAEGGKNMALRVQEWRWTTEDKERIEKWAASLDKDIVSDVFVMSDLVTSGEDVESARLAAARHGADVVLYVKGVAQVDEYADPLAISNLLIVPIWLVPSWHADTLFIMKGAMYDVANGVLYVSAQSESIGKVTAPPAVIETKDSINKAKTQALKKFGDEFIKRVSALKGDESQ